MRSSFNETRPWYSFKITELTHGVILNVKVRCEIVLFANV